MRTYGVPRALERPRRRDPPAARDGGDVEKAVQIAAAAGAPEPPARLRGRVWACDAPYLSWAGLP